MDPVTVTQTLYYEYDGDYIYAAFMQNYKIDLMETGLHWHKFLALLKGLSGTMLNEIMGYRAYASSKTGEAGTAVPEIEVCMDSASGRNGGRKRSRGRI